MTDPDIAALTSLPEVHGVPLGALAYERLPLSASIVEAIREDGKITDFCIVHSNVAAGAGSPDRSEGRGLPLGDVIPAFHELGLVEHFASVVEGRVPQYTAEGVRLAGEYEGVTYDVVVDLVAVPLGGDYVLSLSNDRSAESVLGERLVAAQETLQRRRQLDVQLREINKGLVDDLVQVRRALERNDVQLADEHAARGAARAAEVVVGLRSLVNS